MILFLLKMTKFWGEKRKLELIKLYIKFSSWKKKFEPKEKRSRAESSRVEPSWKYFSLSYGSSQLGSDSSLLAGHVVDTIHLAPTTTLHFDTALCPHWIFYFHSKMRLQRTNIWWGVSVNLSEQEWWCQNDSKVVPRVYKFKKSKTFIGQKTGARLTQNGWVLLFTWYFICTIFKNTICQEDNECTDT